MTLHEVSQATSIISQEAGENANVIFGAVINNEYEDEINVTVIATGFDHQECEIIPSFAAETRSLETFEPAGIGTEPRIDNFEELTAVEMNMAGVGSTREPDLDIPTFLRKQLD